MLYCVQVEVRVPHDTAPEPPPIRRLISARVTPNLSGSLSKPTYKGPDASGCSHRTRLLRDNGPEHGTSRRWNSQKLGK